MPFFAQTTIDRIEQYAIIGYLDSTRVRRWNASRNPSELRATTGYYWQSRKKASDYQQGFKTRSAAQYDAYYNLVKHQAAPQLAGRPLRVVSNSRVA